MADFLNFQSDIHCEEDQLGFDKYIETLSAMINDKGFKTPFCIGIYGKWGSGKTSFMRLLEKELLKDDSEPHAVPVWFNPWRYGKEEHLIIPFLKTIENALTKYVENRKNSISEKLKEAPAMIARTAAAFAYGIKADCKLGGFGFSLDASKMAAREEALASRRMEETRKLSEKLSSIYYEIVNELKNAVDEKSFRIVIFIDDLDRCLPEKAVELLEAIKLFLDIKGYLFIMGVDKEVIKRGIAYRYRHFEYKKEKEEENIIIQPEDYLEKMIQLPLELPEIEQGKKIQFIQSLLGNQEEYKSHADIIQIGVGQNPRTLKQFINLLAFTVRLAETIKKKILADKEENNTHKELLKEFFIPVMYIKWTIIVFRFPDVLNRIKGNKKTLIEFQKVGAGKEKTALETDKIGKKDIEIKENLRKVLTILPLFPDNDWLIDRFIHLSESTVISEKERSLSAGYNPISRQGKMVLIPKGKFLFGDEQIEKQIERDFYIDVFPVTNRQYKKFIDDTNYDVPYGDSDDSKPYRWDKKNRTYPEGMENHPVVLVSHDDAESFCKWRSKNEGLEIRLPTEEEWEKAARGTDGRKYPWGNDFDLKKLNCADFHVGKVLKDYDAWKKEFDDGYYKKNKEKYLTTEVERFVNGIRPYDCSDMAGNVLEWTGSWYDTSEDSKVLRGGSWVGLSDDCRCAYRFYGGPTDRDYLGGFRCARTIDQ